MSYLYDPPVEETEPIQHNLTLNSNGNLAPRANFNIGASTDSLLSVSQILVPFQPIKTIGSPIILPLVSFPINVDYWKIVCKLIFLK